MSIECVCFDMDGTLIRNTDSVKYLCTLNDELDAATKIDALEKNGQISWIEADYLKARLVANLELAEVEELFPSHISIIDNMSLVMNYLLANRIRTVLITAGPIQVAKILGERFGFAEVYGTWYETAGTRFTGRIVRHLGTDGKLEALRAAVTS